MQAVIYYEMPTKRNRRYVKPRVSQAPARKYNRKVKPAVIHQAPVTTHVDATLFSGGEVEKLHTCNECGRSAITTRAAFTILHNH
jgi:hypothetical protein